MDTRRHCQQHEGQRCHGAEYGELQPVVRQPAAHQIADDQTASEDQQDRGDRTVVKATDLRQQGGDVGKDGEDTGKAEHRRQEAHQHGATGHGPQIRPPAGTGRGRTISGQKHGEHDQRDRSHGSDGPEGRPPAELLPQPCARGHAEHGRHGQSREHDRDGRCLPFLRNETCREDRPDAEIGAVGKCRQHPRGHQKPVGGRQGTGDVAKREDQHQADQHQFPVPPVGQHGQDRRTDHNPQCIAGNQQSSGGDAHPQVTADFKKQPHDNKFSDADAEGTGRQCV